MYRVRLTKLFLCYLSQRNVDVNIILISRIMINEFLKEDFNQYFKLEFYLLCFRIKSPVLSCLTLSMLPEDRNHCHCLVAHILEEHGVILVTAAYCSSFIDISCRNNYIRNHHLLRAMHLNVKIVKPWINSAFISRFEQGNSSTSI